MGAAAAEADRTLFVGNLDPKVTEELIFELFHQVPAGSRTPFPRPAALYSGGGRDRRGWACPGEGGYSGRRRTNFRAAPAGPRLPGPSFSGSCSISPLTPLVPCLAGGSGD